MKTARKATKKRWFKVRAVDFFMYHSTDMRRTQRFYQDVLGLKRGEEFNKFWSEFATEPTALAFCGCGRKHRWHGGPCVALAVDDIHRAIDALRGRGVKILVEPEETNVCWMAWIADPDGNRICIHQRKDGSAG